MAPIHGFMDTPLAWLAWTGLHASPWKLIGWGGALMFSGRWFVQLVASKRYGKPVVPRAFWYMSSGGSVLPVSFFIFGTNDSVGVLQNLFPTFTAGYSLYLDIQHRGWRRDKASH